MFGSTINLLNNVFSRFGVSTTYVESSDLGAWKAAMQSDPVSGSKYAQASPDEDFAETWLQYQQVRGTLREYELSRLMPARFAILKTLAP